MDPAPEYKLCKRGHVRSPENITAKRECRACKRLADREYRLSRSQDWLSDRAERMKDYMHQYKQRLEYKSHQRSYRLERTKNMVASYVANAMGIKTSEMPPELAELKRLHITLIRGAKNVHHQRK